MYIPKFPTPFEKSIFPELFAWLEEYIP